MYLIESFIRHKIPLVSNKSILRNIFECLIDFQMYSFIPFFVPHLPNPLFTSCLCPLLTPLFSCGVCRSSLVVLTAVSMTDIFIFHVIFFSWLNLPAQPDVSQSLLHQCFLELRGDRGDNGSH